jgi:anti-sigma B factor antagonist
MSAHSTIHEAEAVMGLHVQVKDGVTILTPRGELWGGAETDELESKIKELARTGNGKLLVNLGKTTFMNSSAISVLIGAYKDHRARGAQLRLCSVGATIDQILVITKLCLLFGDYQYDSEEEALASFTAEKTGRDAVSSLPEGGV